jgi:hypothetical protein
MKKPLLLSVLMAAAMPAVALAQSGIAGTWKLDVNKTFIPDRPDVYLLKDGVYECKSCVPVLTVKSDSQDQAVAGNPHFDTMSIKILDDQSIKKTEKKNGRTVATSKIVVSADGNSAVFEFTDNGGRQMLSLLRAA